MKCGCIERLNDHLAQTNTKIELPIWTASGQITPFVATTKIDQKKRGKPTSVFASHCPFCGVSLSSQQREVPHG